MCIEIILFLERRPSAINLSPYGNIVYIYNNKYTNCISEETLNRPTVWLTCTERPSRSMPTFHNTPH
jgi:hypothetical protein